MLIPTSKITFENESNLIKADGFGVFKLYVRDRVAYIEFCDHDRYRANCRGSRLIEMPLEQFVERLHELMDSDDFPKTG